MLKLPVAEVPSELGWDVIPADLDGLSAGGEEDQPVEGGEVPPESSPAGTADGTREPLWTVPEFEPVETAESDDAMDQVQSAIAVDLASLEATASRFEDIPAPLPFVGTRVVTIEEQFEEALALLRSEAELVSTELKAAYLLAASRLLLGEGRLEEARHAIDESLAADEAFGPTLRFLEDLEREDQRWEALLDVLETMALAAESDAERAAVLIECAQVCMTRLEAPEKAVSFLEDALQAAPEDLFALRLLEQAHR